MTAAAIASVAQTAMTRGGSRTSLQLQAEAAAEAVARAGLELHAVDGLFTTPLGTDSWMMPVAVTAGYLGLTPRHFATVDLAGASGCAMVAQALRAVESGQCHVALCVGGASLAGFGADGDVVRHMAETGTAHPQFELPHGPTLVSLYALLASRYLHDTGATRGDLADIAVAARAFAATNPLALKRSPMTRDEVLASPMISSPLAMLDCSIVCDGAAAVVVTRAARAGPRPVAMIGYGEAIGAPYVSEVRDLSATPAREAGARAFGMAGISPGEVDVALLYDCFTVAVAMELEDLGYCGRGDAGRFVASGRLPVNTHGGLLSGGHPGLAGGLIHVVEAVRQLKGEATNHVADAQVAHAHGNGGVASIHASLILAAA